MIRFRRKNFGWIQQGATYLRKGTSKLQDRARFALDSTSSGVMGTRKMITGVAKEIFRPTELGVSGVIKKYNPVNSVRKFNALNKTSRQQIAGQHRMNAINFGKEAERRITTLGGYKDNIKDAGRYVYNSAKSVLSGVKDRLKNAYTNTGGVINNTVNDFVKNPISTSLDTFNMFKKDVNNIDSIIGSVRHQNWAELGANTSKGLLPTTNGTIKHVTGVGPINIKKEAAKAADSFIDAAIPGIKSGKKKFLNTYNSSNFKKKLDNFSIEKGVNAVGRLVSKIPITGVNPSSAASVGMYNRY